MNNVIELLKDVVAALEKFIAAAEAEEAVVEPIVAEPIEESVIEKPIIEEPAVEEPIETPTTEPVEEPGNQNTDVVEEPIETVEPVVEEPKPSVDIDVIAGEVLEGKWGSGDKRKQNLEAAGYDYNAVQSRVNQILTVVQEVLDRKWGNGDERKQKLEEAGYNYEVIQKEINRQLEKKTLIDDLLNACKVQADWMKNSKYEYEKNPTIEKSKKKGTCVTYVACVLQRIGILLSGQNLWHDENNKVYGNNSKMTVIYPGNKTLSQVKSQLKAGDIVMDGSGVGSNSHIFILTGDWSGNKPKIWDNHSAQEQKGAYYYGRDRRVIAIVRLK